MENIVRHFLEWRGLNGYILVAIIPIIEYNIFNTEAGKIDEMLAILSDRNRMT